MKKDFAARPDAAEPADAEVLLRVSGLEKRFGTGTDVVTVLGGIDLDVRRGEFVCIVGPSGCGKSTLLGCLSGLITPTSGMTTFGGRVVTTPPEKMAVVFQDYSRSLLPWMRVAGNIGLPLRKKLKVPKRREQVAIALENVGLKGKGHLYPWQMSGGMQQRAAIARGLAYQPDVLLMDEPFASVDAQTRVDLEDLVLTIRRSYNTTVLFVTHDIDEAVYMGDRVVVLSGSPTTVTEDIQVDLAHPRHQIDTKLDPRYGTLRAHVFKLIQAAKHDTATDN